jgi:cytochrome P450
MTWFANFLTVVGRGLVILTGALASLFQLAIVGVSALFGEGTLGERLGVRFGDPSNQRHVFKVLRTFAPILVIRRRVVQAYDNSGTAIVTRDVDVREVLDHDSAFQVVYAPKMEKITGGGNFFLGMQGTPEYTRDTSTMRLSARREDVASILVPFVAAEANQCIAKSNGRLDIPQTLILPLLARMVGHYFGTPGPSEQVMIEWTTAMFRYLFVDLAGDPDVEAEALSAAHKCREYLDSVIAGRKASARLGEDVLGRCLEMQQAGVPGLDDVHIRNNLIGLIIGAIPTISAACTQSLDVLFDRPEELRGAQAAAMDDDDEKLARYVFEAFRFNPLNPILYRIAARDYVIARGTLRARRIPKDTMVLVANLSAMFDDWSIPDADAFRLDRPWSSYILFGYGMHTCFGEAINRAVMPQILKPLLAGGNLRRATGKPGELDRQGTPFPVHMEVEFDPR